MRRCTRVRRTRARMHLPGTVAPDRGARPGKGRLTMATRKNKTEITLDTTPAPGAPARRATRALAQQPTLPGLASAVAQQPARYVTLAPSTISAPLPVTTSAPIHRDAR